MAIHIRTSTSSETEGPWEDPKMPARVRSTRQRKGWWQLEMSSYVSTQLDHSAIAAIRSKVRPNCTPWSFQTGFQRTLQVTNSEPNVQLRSWWLSASSLVVYNKLGGNYIGDFFSTTSAWLVPGTEPNVQLRNCDEQASLNHYFDGVKPRFSVNFLKDLAKPKPRTWRHHPNPQIQDRPFNSNRYRSAQDFTADATAVIHSELSSTFSLPGAPHWRWHFRVFPWSLSFRRSRSTDVSSHLRTFRERAPYNVQYTCMNIQL